MWVYQVYGDITSFGDPDPIIPIPLKWTGAKPLQVEVLDLEAIGPPRYCHLADKITASPNVGIGGAYRKLMVVGDRIPGCNFFRILERERATVDGKSGARVGSVAIKSHGLVEAEKRSANKHVFGWGGWQGTSVATVFIAMGVGSTRFRGGKVVPVVQHCTKDNAWHREF